jgi:chloramphenicol-sensitive protein RarD
MWGFFPIYFKALQVVPSLQIMLHRVVWSFLFVMLLILMRREWPRFRDSLRKPRVLLTYTLTAGLLAVNWLIFIYGINSGQVVETSLGYFINPLLSVALGVVFLRERLRPMQWFPVGLAALDRPGLSVHFRDVWADQENCSVGLSAWPVPGDRHNLHPCFTLLTLC